jgi:F-type H+-transporting ATPase subunit delta
MEHMGKQKATVFTPYELTPETRSAITAGLEKDAGRKIELEQVVDKTLIGGIKVQIGDMVYDGSVRSGLERMKEALGAARL